MHPTPIEVRQAREAAGLTQRAAGAVIMASERAWQDWEGGRRRMPWSKYALFLMWAKRGGIESGTQGDIESGTQGD